MTTRKVLLMLLLVGVCAVGSWAGGTPEGHVVRVNPDRTFDASFDKPPGVGDTFSLIRDRESIGEVIITTVTSGRIAGMASEGFLGRPKIGDELVFSRAAGAPKGDTSWISWSSPDGGYKIFAPRHHEARQRRQKRGPISVEEHLDIFTDDAQKQQYMVLWFDIPDDFLSNGDKYASESESVKEELKKRDFTIVSKAILSYRGMECLEEDCRMTDLFLRQRVFFTTHRLFQLIGISAYRQIPTKAQRFYNSFELLSAAGRPLKAPAPQADFGILRAVAQNER